jgi:hypothetical protein
VVGGAQAACGRRAFLINADAKHRLWVGVEDVGAVDRLDSWSGQSPFRRKRSALQRSNPYGFRIAVLNAIVPHDIENDRIAARVPIDRIPGYWARIDTEIQPRC